MCGIFEPREPVVKLRSIRLKPKLAATLRTSMSFRRMGDILSSLAGQTIVSPPARSGLREADRPGPDERFALT
jgi:hypothetical protein